MKPKQKKEKYIEDIKIAGSTKQLQQKSEIKTEEKLK